MNAAELEAALAEVAPVQESKQPAVVELINAAELLAERPTRGHLGYSEIGEADARTLWLKFRWCLPDIEDARLLRLFRLGDTIEVEAIALLNAVNPEAAELAGVRATAFGKTGGLLRVFETDPRTGAQFNFADDVGGHFAGSLDGIAQGLPDCPTGSAADWVVLEIKSAKASRFKEFQAKGVKAVDLKYWAQVQCYTHKTGLDWALFIIYCKDNSELYAEWVQREPQAYWALLSKAEEVIEAATPPASSYPNRNWFEIKNFKSVEYQQAYWLDVAPPVSCRTCRHASPVTCGKGAQWWCQRHESSLSTDQQLLACEMHQYIPELLPALTFLGVGELGVEYATEDGRSIINAEWPAHQPDKATYSSAELRELSRVNYSASLTDGLAQEVREQFGAQLIKAEPI